MADNTIQLVTFQLGSEQYGIDIKIETADQMEQLCRLAGWFDQKWEWEEWEYKMWLLRNAANECGLDLRELAHRRGPVVADSAET